MNYYSDYIKKLKLVCENKKISLIEIGQINDLPMYKTILNPFAKKVVVFSAGIHGDEIAGPLAMIELLKQFNFQNYPDIKTILFPVASPTAFNNKKRCNYLDQDLNRLFCEKELPSENKILLQQLTNEKISFFHALHEDLDEYFFYLYNFENKEEKIYRDIIPLGKELFPINKSAKISNYSINGLIINHQDGSFEDRMFRDGAHYSMCTETPGKQLLEERISLNFKIMNKVIEFTSHL